MLLLKKWNVIEILELSFESSFEFGKHLDSIVSKAMRTLGLSLDLLVISKNHQLLCTYIKHWLDLYY